MVDVFVGAYVPNREQVLDSLPNKTLFEAYALEYVWDY
jgi:hypothetical protein